MTATPPAPPADAAAHFARLLAVETDCWDVHQALTRKPVGFVLLDARTPEAFAHWHIPGARNLHHPLITAEAVAEYPADTLFVVYSTSWHCNGADHAALRLARLGRPVKKLLGGIAGWRYERYEVELGK